MSASVESVRCLVINLSGTTVLVPGAVVAEVTNYAEPSEIHVDADWLSGMFAWRGVSLPLVDLEKMAGLAGIEAAVGKKVVVFYGLQGKPGLQFYGVIVNGVPKVVNVRPEQIEQDTLGGGHELFEAAGKLEGIDVVVPDFARLESMIAQYTVVRASA